MELIIVCPDCGCEMIFTRDTEVERRLSIEQDITREIGAKHNQLVDTRRAESASEKATAFIREIEQAGAKVSTPSGREYLRAIAHFWVAVIYDATNFAPKFNLLPFIPELE